MPPLYFKVWQWLRMEADYDTRQLTTTSTYLAERIAWTERNALRVPSRKTIRTILMWLDKNSLANVEVSGGRNAKYYTVTIVNSPLRADDIPEVVTQESHLEKHKVSDLKEVQEIKEVQKTTKFVDLMADAWSSISAPDQTPPYSMFNKWRAAHGEALCLAGIRKVSMNGKTFDGSPLAYVASVITAMAGEAQQSLEAAASDPQLIFPDNMVGQHIVYPNTNNPIKDRTKRMAAILGRDPSASADPDPDHPWTIPDSEFNA